jgi:CheY-like chemotaxis protein
VALGLPQPGPTFADYARDADLDFTSPPALKDAAAAAPFDVVAVRTHLGHAGNRVVLVVDADEASGERTAAILRDAGYHAAVERTPRGAARHMARLGPPALLLLEADLPQMHGIDFLQRLRASKRLAATPVVLYAVHAARADLVHALEAGADGYISKPADAATLLAALRKVLDE